MALLTVTSPHTHSPLKTSTVMQLVLLATLPGLFALTWFFGFGSIVNVLCASLLAVVFEAAVLALRKRPINVYLSDYSALVTAFLLGIALPPYSPWWLIAIGIGSAIIMAKHLYGGLGYNPFNPAMIGYVVLLISFPLEMTRWAAPLGSFDGATPGFIDAVTALFSSPQAIDATTMATPLDVLKQNNTLLMDELRNENPQFGRWAGLGWEWVNAGFLVGGLFLLWRRVFTWHAPLSMLGSLFICSVVGYYFTAGSAANTGSPLFHLFSGATMFGAFFIVTDPVTSAVSTTGRLIYGALIGLLLYLIRTWGNYPDAIAFAVLLMNFAAPLLDYYTQPRTYGHSSGRGGKP